jgi:hypothetical protein
LASCGAKGCVSGSALTTILSAGEYRVRARCIAIISLIISWERCLCLRRIGQMEMEIINAADIIVLRPEQEKQAS